MAYEVAEQVFTTVEDACLKVIRTFTITNWCNYEIGQQAVRISRDENEHGFVEQQQIITSFGYEKIGRLEYIQVLKVVDNTAPVISIDTVDTCIKGADCGETKQFSISAQDCNEVAEELLTYSWMFSAGGVQIAAGTGNSFEAIVAPKVGYEVKWTVQDNCGNTAWEIENYEFWDCKKPAPYCLHGVAVDLMQITGMVDVWASDLERGSFDNCTPKERLDFRIWHASLGEEPTKDPGVATLPKVVTFDCTTLGTQTVILYVIDEEGNFDFCVTYVLIQDNTGACNDVEPPAGEMALVSGIIMDWKQQTVENVVVNAKEGQTQTQGTTSTEYLTKADGHYQFEMEMYNNYTIQPQKEDFPLNGVSTFDLVLMSKHILGIQVFDNPYQLIAADVNKSGTITAFDMVQIRQLILNIKTDFSNNNSWRFVETAYEFTSDNPLTENFPEVGTIEDLHRDMWMDFVAIKIGDVNGNANPNSLITAEERTTDKVFEIRTEDRDLKAGETYSFAFTTDQFDKVQGYQFTLAYHNLKVEKLHSGVANVGNFGLHNMDKGMITTSWNQDQLAVGSEQLAVNQQNANSQLATGNLQLTTLFTIEFTALYDGKLSEQLSMLNRPTTIEAYNENGELMDIQLTITTPLYTDEFELFQNQPNPFHNETSIGFYLPDDSEIQLILRDETGRILKTLKEDRKAGYNSIEINKAELTNGFIYYQLSSKFGSKAKKMIQVR